MRQVTGMTGMTSSGLSGLSTSRLGGGALERPFVPGTMAKTLPLPLGSIHPSKKKKTIHYIFNHVKLRARSFTNISRKECTRRGRGGKTGFFFFFFLFIATKRSRKVVDPFDPLVVFLSCVPIRLRSNKTDPLSTTETRVC